MDAPSTSPMFMTLSCFRQAGVHNDEVVDDAAVWVPNSACLIGDPMDSS